jgi:CRP/FNR family cyclic AMP-dependent transcriptional regulator
MRMAKPKISGTATGWLPDGQPKGAKSMPEARIAPGRARRRSSRVDVTKVVNNLLGRGSMSRYRRDHIIFGQGDPANSVFYIQNGEVRLTVVSPRGKSAIIAVLGGGDFLGEGCLTGQPLHMATATAAAETTVVRIEKDVVTRLLSEDAAFSDVFVAYLLARSVRIQEDLVDQLFNSTEKRLARMLLLLAGFGKERSPEPVVPRVTQEALAEMIGTTRARVSGFMNKFRKLGLIDYNGGLHVHEALMNVVLHD